MPERKSRGIWLICLLVGLSLISLPQRVEAQLDFGLLGTQVGELEKDFRPVHYCDDCHGGFDWYAPFDSWSGSMMANAARDPLFFAALTVAEQDVPGVGELCIRCHSPRGYLFGRAEPTDGTALGGQDLEGISCDFCHRLDPGPDGEWVVGNGQYFVGDDGIRRGPISDPLPAHETRYVPAFEDSTICAICHDVSNPLIDNFPIERTYTEWVSSAFPDEGTTCLTCHLPAREGLAAGSEGAPTREVHVHQLVGGNSWMPRVLAGEYAQLNRAEGYAATIEAALEMLESAASVEIQAPDRAQAGATLELSVHVENLAGHKLPTGYPEGRRTWLRVTVDDAEGRRLFESGAYDLATATRASDAQLRVYEVQLAAGGEEGFHFALQDERRSDTRIPPRGFRPNDETIPVGREYPLLDDGTMAHWDDAPYQISLPDDTPETITVTAELLYQTTSRDYVEFLRDENHSDDRGQVMYDLWEEYGRAEPVPVATATLVLDVEPGGCGCSTMKSQPKQPLHLPLLVLVGLVLRRRHTGRVGLSVDC